MRSKPKMVTSPTTSTPKREAPGPKTSTGKKACKIDYKDLADCPFTVRLVAPEEARTTNKRRKKDADNGVAVKEVPEVREERSRFQVRGKFSTTETMDVHYAVDPIKEWTDMHEYTSFMLNGTMHHCDGYVYVANEASVLQQRAAVAKSASEHDATESPEVLSPAVPDTKETTYRPRAEDDWVARILEVRAKDELNVYARVFWMYWPDELPVGTHCNRRPVRGRQAYHGDYEVIASNHMDIINVVSVTSEATVEQLMEDENEIHQNLYWRQALNVNTMDLSTAAPTCACLQPANPDKCLVGCSNGNCGRWLHEECITHYTLLRVFKAYGRNKPYTGTPLVEPKTKAARPKRPAKTGGAVSAVQSIGVKPRTTRPGAAGSCVIVGTPPDQAMTTPNDEATAANEEASAAMQKLHVGISKDVKKTHNMATKRGFRRNHPFDGKKKAYEGYFDATLLLTPSKASTAPTVVEITDLRSNVESSTNVWLEAALCPSCGEPVG